MSSSYEMVTNNNNSLDNGVVETAKTVPHNVDCVIEVIPEEADPATTTRPQPSVNDSTSSSSAVRSEIVDVPQTPYNNADFAVNIEVVSKAAETATSTTTGRQPSISLPLSLSSSSSSVRSEIVDVESGEEAATTPLLPPSLPSPPSSSSPPAREGTISSEIGDMESGKEDETKPLLPPPSSPPSQPSQPLPPPPPGKEGRNGTIFFDDIPRYVFDDKKYVVLPEDKIDSDELVDFLQNKKAWNLGVPQILINTIGDITKSYLSPKLLKSVIESLFRMTKNTWFVNLGHQTEINKHVGLGVKQVGEKCNLIENEECNVRVTSLGVCQWERIVGKQTIEREEGYDWKGLKHDEQMKKYVLAPNNTHFIAVMGGDCTDGELKDKLFKKIQVPRANLLLGGDKESIDQVAKSLKEDIPCIVVEGTKGVADRLVTYVRFLRDSATPKNKLNAVIDTILNEGEEKEEDRQSFRDCLERYERIAICDPFDFKTEEIQDLLLRGHFDFIYHRSSITDNEQNHRRNFLQLCHSWNCLGIATKVIWWFDGQRDREREDLTHCLMSSLKDGNVAFAHLLVDHDGSIIESLTKKHFRELYQSDKILLEMASQLCEHEIDDIHGIHQVGEEIQSFFHSADFDFDRQFHLFLWAIIYMKYELAEWLWNVSNFPIANGLIANSIMRTVIRTDCTNAENKAIIDKVANQYEERASSLLTKCHDRSPMRTKFLLLRNMPSIGDMSCLELATKDDKNANFLANPVPVAHMDDIWWKCGSRAGSTFVNFITFITCVAFFIFLLSPPLAILERNSWIMIAALSVFPFTFGVVTIKRLAGVSYKRFLSIDDADERKDLKELPYVDENEVHWFLKFGIPMGMLRNRYYQAGWNHWDIYHFLDTPQVKFNLQILSFSMFLSLFAFLILSAPPNFASTTPSRTEWSLFIYFVAFVVNEMKQLHGVEIEKRGSSWSHFSRKFWSHFDSKWNRMDAFLSFYFFLIIVARLSLSRHSEPLATQITLFFYSGLFALYCLRLLQFFAVSQTLGPKLIMIRLMIGDLLKILLYIIVIALAYAVCHKVIMRSITSEFLVGEDGKNSSTGWKDGKMEDEKNSSTPNSPIDYFLEVNSTDLVYFVEDLWSHPFWHLFGEGFLDSYEEHLPNQTNANDSVHKLWMIKIVAPLLRLIYMIITVVLLLNLMIAIFGFSINEIQERANHTWSIYRKDVIFEYRKCDILPPPFSLICGVYSFVTWCRKDLFLPESQWFRCSTLNFRVKKASSEVNPYSNWLEFICKWEKLLQRRHLINVDKLLQRRHLINVDKPSSLVANDGQRRASETIKIMEVQETLKNLQPLDAQSSTPSGGYSHEPLDKGKGKGVKGCSSGVQGASKGSGLVLVDGQYCVESKF